MSNIHGKCLIELCGSSLLTEHLNFMIKLLSSQYDFDKDTLRNSMIQLCRCGAETSTIDIMVELGVDLASDSDIYISECCASNQIDTLMILLEKGCIITRNSVEGIYFIINFGNIDIIETLINEYNLLEFIKLTQVLDILENSTYYNYNRNSEEIINFLKKYINDIDPKQLSKIYFNLISNRFAESKLLDEITNLFISNNMDFSDDYYSYQIQLRLINLINECIDRYNLTMSNELQKLLKKLLENGITHNKDIMVGIINSNNFDMFTSYIETGFNLSDFVSGIEIHKIVKRDSKIYLYLYDKGLIDSSYY